MHLPNDHTGGTRAGKAAPTASVADNDLALGRIVEAVGHSPYWDDTAIFVVGRRRAGWRGSRGRAPLGRAGHQQIRARLRRSSLSLNTLLYHRERCAQCGRTPWLAPDECERWVRAADGRILLGSRESGAIRGGHFESREWPDLQSQCGGRERRERILRMDFSRPDAVDTRVLNAILWRERKGKHQMPAAKHTVIPAGLKPDDD